MAPGYEWVFVICHATMGFGTLLAIYAGYLSHQERKSFKVGARTESRRPRPPRQVF